jgi:ABC-type Fe3+ transport system substrate-binding protein
VWKKRGIPRIFFFIFMGAFSFFPAHAAEKLVIISPHWEGVRTEIGSAFIRYYARTTGKTVEIEWIDQGGTSDDIKYVESLFQKSPSGIGIDLFFGGGLDPYLRLKEKGLLLPYRLPTRTLANLPKFCQGIPNYDPEGYWYGIVLAGFGILYNKKVLDFIDAPAPVHWRQLADGRYRGWIGASDPRHSGSMHMMFEIILQTEGWNRGWKTIMGIAGNTRNFPTSASQSARDTSLGEVAATLAIDSYALSQIEINGAENMGFVLPEGATVINPDAVGILKGAPHLEIAREFLLFLLSEQCQLIWMLPRGSKGGPKEFSLNRLSILPSVYQKKGISFPVNPYAMKTTLQFDFERASQRWALVNDLMGACVIDCADFLRIAYSYVLSGTCDADLFYTFPVGEEAAQKFALRWKDQVFRNQKINEFLRFSLHKFKVCAQAGRR